MMLHVYSSYYIMHLPSTLGAAVIATHPIMHAVHCSNPCCALGCSMIPVLAETPCQTVQPV